MNTKNTVLERNPSRRQLVTALGFPSGKLPADFTFDDELPLQGADGWVMCIAHIVVTPTKPSGRTRTRWNPDKGVSETKPVKSSKHRIFAKFGNRLIPVGRLAQAIL